MNFAFLLSFLLTVCSQSTLLRSQSSNKCMSGCYKQITNESNMSGFYCAKVDTTRSTLQWLRKIAPSRRAKHGRGDLGSFYRLWCTSSPAQRRGSSFSCCLFKRAWRAVIRFCILHLKARSSGNHSPRARFPLSGERIGNKMLRRSCTRLLMLQQRT